MYHIVVNPVAGHGHAEAFVSDHVIPLLNALDETWQRWTTSKPGSAVDIARSISGDPSEGFIKLIVAGGDGTAHEIIEGAMSAGKAIRWEMDIIPLGTANALHASLFANSEPRIQSSLESIVSKDAEVRRKLASLLLPRQPDQNLRRLPLASTNMIHPDSQHMPLEPIYSHIVTSTSLHAALLQTSEELRAEHPGLERFKMAAERNLGVFFQANVKLLPPDGSSVKQYDPHTKSFVEPYTTDAEGTLDGPFTYFLATTVCERLEPTFVINPTLKTIPPDPTVPTMDIVVLRPLRDPDVKRADEAERPDKWKKRAMEVIGAAYRDGAHVDLTYPDEGGEAVVEGSGMVAVETFRVGGFEWTPTDPEHSPSHLVCSDGAIQTVPTGGTARVQMARQSQNEPSFCVRT